MSPFSSIITHLKLRGAEVCRAPHAGVLAAVALAIPAVLAAVLVSAVAPALDGAERIPVAVVNLDEGSRGRELVESLVDAEDLHWCEVDEGDATAGLASDSYALALVIPADYTEKVESVEGTDPEKATLDLVSDGTGNVLATRVGGAVMRQVQGRLKSELGERYLLNVLNDVRGQASRLTLAADGSTMLDAGYDALADGANGIARALAQVGGAATRLTDGLGQMGAAAVAAGEGASAIGEGLTAVREQAVESLTRGASALSSGLEQAAAMAEGMGRGVSGVSQMVEGVDASVAGALGSAAALGDVEKSLERDGKTLGEALGQADGALRLAADAVQRVDEAVGGEARESAAAVSSSLQELAGMDAHGKLSAVRAAVEDAVRALAMGSPSDGPSTSEVGSVGEDTDASQEAIGVLNRALESLNELDASLGGVDIAVLSERAASLSSGLTAAADAAAQLQQGEQQLGDAQARASGAMEGLRGALASASGSLGKLSGNLMAAQTILSGRMTGQGMTLVELTSSLGSGVSALGAQLSGDGMVGKGAAGLAAGSSAVGQALTPLAAATDQLAQGSSTLGAALSGIGAGASGLGGGLAAMSEATGQLAGGSLRLKDASGQLMETMGKAGDALSVISSQSAERAEVASSPVAFNAVRNNEASSTASSVAPAFIVAALWVGALLAVLVLPPLDIRAILSGWTLRGAMAPMVSYGALGVLQALVIGAVCVLFCGVEPTSPMAFWALLAAGAIAFALMAQAVAVVCGRWTPFALLLLLAVQLVSAGVILPEALASGPFAALGDVLPMPVLATALRGAVSGTLAGLLPAVALLAALVAASLAASLLAALARRSVRPERLPA